MMSKLSKLKEIQGLRAFAVFSVIGFHVNPEIISKGFLGVDVFFIISGFLITQILLNLETEITLYQFYLNRLKRIYPALVLVVSTSSLVGFYIARNVDLELISNQSVITLLGLINIYFALQPQGYFAGESGAQPLLHLWSIAVEIQFYLIWPLVIRRIIKMKQYYIWIVLTSLFMVSYLFYIEVLAFQSLQNFYLIFGRIWEFLLGSFISLIGILFRKSNNSKSTFYSYIIMIAIIVLMIPTVNNFLKPKITDTILVTLSALLIYFITVRREKNYLLNNKLLVYLGNLSYSLYLWHWPVFYFGKYFNLESSTSSILLMLATIFILSNISYFFWENAFRGNKNSPKLYIFLLLIFLIYVFASSVLVNRTQIFQNRFQGIKQEISSYDLRNEFSVKGETCFSDLGVSYNAWNKSCLPEREKNEQNLILVWGDSHVLGPAEAIEFSFNQNNFVHARASTSSCPPIYSIPNGLSENDMCAENNQNVWDYIIKNKPDTLILTARWYLYANKIWYESGLRSLQVTIDEAQKIGIKKIVLIANSPEWDEDLPMYLWKQQIGQKLINSYIENNRVNVLQNINLNLKEMALAAGIEYIDPMDFFCKGNTCKAFTWTSNQDFYPTQIDTDHLSVGASKEVLAKLDFS